ncbi:hypothetical protein EPUS_07331 [Endocarpon pusillum Z07020]|uniref:Attractin/MKLN-like beta-propeller domain-containing protein n=1 Tax=Endocarpon pusillum (strain Z07020 / HMAS-L-300199) TaxID=1263415 RepID=U1GWI3_ENDPU|nr:uncharacterized protein EPUS_07331 [Endocarpon pusillum Z07020]ERF76451.1 hypothetical protein EPUS_07331 [Endocarpon pusillum Z07020]
MARSISFLLLGFCLVILDSVLSQAPSDPVQDFCRRFSHQTALINRQLYIDGGFVNANPLSQNPRAVANPNLLVQDLDVLENGMPKPFANLSKNATVPSVSGGILWEDDVNQVFYLYGGEYPLVPNNFELWAYDIPLNQWNVTAQSATSSEVQRVAWGAGTTVGGRAEGYYYGGYLNNSTTPGWNASPLATSTLVRYDMIANSWTNNTGPDSVGRAEGVMVTIPASRQGLLVYFGGVAFPYRNSTEVASSMSTIFLYDIAEGKWYQQNATGQVPENRRKFCAGATWAQDQSSYNIYLYGGAGFAENATGFDDVYILTLPSFTWIKWYPTEPGPGSPHNSLSCNVVDNAQMLIIGGTFPATDACDAPDVVGTHNLDLGKNNPDQAKWNLFNPNLTTYNVPSEIISVVGGSPVGGATVTAPTQGWDHRDLPVYFQQQATHAVRTPTRALPTTGSTPNQSSRSNRGAIIGGAVGGAVAFLLLAGLAIFLCIRRRGRREPANNSPTTVEPSQPSPLPPSAHLPSYIEHKPFPSAPPTTMHPALARPPASPDLSYTSTPPPMIRAPAPGPAPNQDQYQDPHSPPLHSASSQATQVASPIHNPLYQHPAHIPASQQQPYFPPPPARDRVPDEQEQSSTTGPSYEMPTMTSPRPRKKTWGD